MGEWRGIWGRVRLGLGVTSTIAAAALTAAAPAGASGAATTFTVTGFADGAESCNTLDANGNVACTTLRAAAHQASLQANSPTIELQAGTYQLTAASGGQLDMGAFTIQGAGPGGPSGTTIQQTDGKDRVIEVEAGPAKLAGLEVTGGDLAPGWSSGTTWMGGGILAQGPLSLQNVLVMGNQVAAPSGPTNPDAGDGAEGGGIDYIVGTAAGSTITNSTISGNSAIGGSGASGGAAGGNSFGGGVAYEGDGSLVIQESTLSGNAAVGGLGGSGAGSGGSGGYAEGGGIFNSGNVTVIASTIAGNAATGGRGGTGASGGTGGSGSGGGIEDVEALAQIVNTTVFDNVAQGGGAVSGGSAGLGEGGGVLDTGSEAGAVLQSDTIDANQTSSDDSNLDIFVGNPPNPYVFTVHDTIVAGGTPSSAASCDFHLTTSPPTSESGNLEDDSADSCGFKTTNHDLVGVNPQLATTLTNNAGPTQTLMPARTSPVLGAGGQCLDPTSTPPNQPLAADQRGEPRPDPCDIGAFQSQAPRNTVPPLISGRVMAGQTLSCSPGVWTGDGPLTFGYQWLRDGVVIPPAGSSSYRIETADIGHALACLVTGTHYGSVSARSASADVLPIPVVTLLKFKLTGRTVAVRLGCRGADGEVCGGIVKLTTVEQWRGKKLVAVIASKKRVRRHTVLLALAGYTITVGRTVTLRLYAGAPAGQLLMQFGKLPVRLAVQQSTALGTQTPASRILKLRPRPAQPRGASG